MFQTSILAKHWLKTVLSSLQRMDREKPTSTQSYTESRTCDFCIFFIFTPFLSMTIALHATHSAVTCERDIAFESFLVIDLFAISPVDALFPSRVGGHLETNLRLRVRGKGFACLLHYLLFEDFECLVFLVGSLYQSTE